MIELLPYFSASCAFIMDQLWSMIFQKYFTLAMYLTFLRSYVGINIEASNREMQTVCILHPVCQANLQQAKLAKQQFH